MSFLKIKDYPQYVREINSNSIINVDEKAYQEHLKKKKLLKLKQQEEEFKNNRINNLEEKVQIMQGQLETIINLLTKK